MIEQYTLMDFGKLLEKLIHLSEQKNYALATYLGYDVSYISKWITKNILPASKNIHSICDNIALFFVSASSTSSLDLLYTYFAIPSATNNTDELFHVIKQELLNSYAYATKANKEDSDDHKPLNNARFVINPRMQRLTLSSCMPYAQQQDIILFSNLLLLGKEDKLSIAGFDKTKGFELSGSHLQMMISLEREPQNTEFDAILLIYMITNYANIEFQLHITRLVPCSLMLAIKDMYAHTSILLENHRCIASHTSTDKQAVNELHASMDDVIHTQSKRVFNNVTMAEMIKDYYYMQSIISPDIRWLIGSMSELFLPDDLFEELLKRYFPDDKEYQKTLQKNHLIMQSVTYLSPSKILIYETTISKYILDGKLDFFSKPIILDMKQREQHIAYMRDLFEHNTYMEVRLVNGNFIEDFKKFDNPSIYLSANLSYLRIAGNLNQSLYIIKSKQLLELFSDFYTQIWNERLDIVLSDVKRIQEKMNYYVDCFKFFNDIE